MAADAGGTVDGRTVTQSSLVEKRVTRWVGSGHCEVALHGMKISIIGFI